MDIKSVTVGRTYWAWSQRVFGLRVRFTVTKVGYKLVHGDFYYQGNTWHGKINPDRLDKIIPNEREITLGKMGSENGQFPSYAWPGGYPILYVMDDGGILCGECMNNTSNPVHFKDEDNTRDGWLYSGGWIAEEPNEDGTDITCDHCNNVILEGDES